MPAGLQVFAPGNVLVADHTTNYGRYLGMIWTGNYPSKSFSDPAILTGRPWYMRVSDTTVPFIPIVNATNIVISGSTISWQYPPVVNQRHCWIMYGVY